MKATNCLAGWILFLILFGNTPFLKAQGNDIIYTIANDVSSTNWLEFDLFLYDPDPAQPFELCSVQAGILVNSQIYGGGTITAQIIEGSSSLNPAQVPTSVIFAPCEGAIKLSAMPPPGCGLGTKISQDPDHRTRICRIRLSNSMPFAPCSSANLTFCFSTTPFPTKLNYYSINCNPISVALNSTNCYSLAQNLPLNPSSPAPIAYFVSGSGSYCIAGIGLPVELSGSETNVAYRLYKDGISQTPVVQGTGLPLYFGNQLAGTYTIEGYRTCGSVSVYTTLMTGSAIISTADSTIPGIVSGPDSAIEGSTVITLNLNGNNGNVLRWQKRLNGGAWTDIGINSTTYSEVPSPNGTWEYLAKVQNSTCPSVSSSSCTVSVLSRTLSVKLLLQGLYQAGSGMMDKAKDANGDYYPGEIADLVTIQLADVNHPHITSFLINDVPISRSGDLSLNLPAGSTASYYLVLHHRNSLETWSALPLDLGEPHISYNFTSGAHQAFGNNQLLSGNVSMIYGGEVNQDGIVDSGDMIGVDNAASVFSTGYISTDVNGDGLVDSGDMILVDNNASQFIGKITP